MLMDFKNLGRFLAKKRLEAGLTQVDVSTSLGYDSAQYVSNWERGECPPPLNKLKEVAKVLKIAPDEIISLIVKETQTYLEEQLNTPAKRLKRK
jgi:transcriptional regulator with XRE-family HTH domain